jgi:taurine transport system substrate-binding protein
MAIAKAVSGQADQVGAVLALYEYPTLEGQVSSTWLGGGVQSALMAASEFLTAQGKLDSVLDSYKDSATPKYAQMVLDGKC